MIFRRVTAIAIACVVAVSMFAGCTKSGGNAENTQQKSESAGTEKSEATGAEMVGNMYKTGLPIVKDKVTLKVVMSVIPLQGKLEDMAFFKQLEEKTNVHIEWEAIPSANYNDKKNMMFAGGDLPDIFYGTMSLTTEELAKFSGQGIFQPMDDLIENYAPNIKALFKEKPFFKKTCQDVTDGKIYSVGRAAERESQVSTDNMFIYKPWLDKLGLKVPETTEDFYNVLKAFRTKDPNGNGKADEIPFSFVYANAIYGLNSLFGSFGRVDVTSDTNKGSYGSHFVIDESGKLVYTADKKEYKDAISYFNRMFKEDLFDKEGFTAKDTKNLISKGNSEEVVLGCYMGWSPSVEVKKDRVNDYIPLAPLKGPSGGQIWAKSGHSNMGYIATGFTVTKSNKYPEISVRWLDQHFDKQTSIEAFLGPVGINLKEGTGGMLEYIDTPQGMSDSEFRFKNAPVHVPCAIALEDWNKKIKLMAEDAYKVDVINKYYKPYLVNSTSYMKFNQDEMKIITTLGKDIDEYTNQMQAKWMLDGGIEQGWDAYVEKLKQLKLDEYVKMYQDAYARWTGK